MSSRQSSLPNFLISLVAACLLLGSCTNSGCLDPGDDGDEVKSIISSIYPLNVSNADVSEPNLAVPLPGKKEADMRFPWQSVKYNKDAPREQKDQNGSKLDFFVYKGKRVAMTVQGSVNLAGYTIKQDVPLKIREVSFNDGSGGKSFLASEIIPSSIFTVPGSIVNATCMNVGGSGADLPQSTIDQLKAQGVDPATAPKMPQVPKIGGVALNNCLGLYITLVPVSNTTLGRYGDSTKWMCHNALPFKNACTGAGDNISGCSNNMMVPNCDLNDRAKSWCSGNIYAAQNPDLFKSGESDDSDRSIDLGDRFYSATHGGKGDRDRLRFPFFLMSPSMRYQVKYAYGDNDYYKGINVSSGTANKDRKEYPDNTISYCATLFSTPWSNLREFSLCTHDYTIPNWATNMTPIDDPLPQIATMYHTSPVSRWYFTKPGTTCDDIDKQYKIREFSGLYGGFYNYVLSNSMVFWGNASDNPTLNCDSNEWGVPYCTENTGSSSRRIRPTICPNSKNITLKWPLQIVTANIPLPNLDNASYIENCKLKMDTSTQGSMTIAMTADKMLSSDWPTYPKMLEGGEVVSFSIDGGEGKAFSQGHGGYECSSATWFFNAMVAEAYSSIVGWKYCSSAMAYGIKPIGFVSCFANYRSGCSNERVPAAKCDSRLTTSGTSFTGIGACTKRIGADNVKSPSDQRKPQSYKDASNPRLNTLVDSGSVFSDAENIQTRHCGVCIRKDLSMDERTGLRVVEDDTAFSDSTISSTIRHDSDCQASPDYTWSDSYYDKRIGKVTQYEFKVNAKASFCPDSESTQLSSGSLRSLTNVIYNHKVGDMLYGSLFSTSGTVSTSAVKIPDDGKRYMVAFGYAGNGSDIQKMFTQDDISDNVDSNGNPAQLSVTLSSGIFSTKGENLYMYVQEFKKNSEGEYTDVLDPAKHPAVVFGEKTHHDDIAKKIVSDQSLPVMVFKALDLVDGEADGAAEWLSNYSGKIWFGILDVNPAVGNFKTDGRILTFSTNEMEENLDPTVAKDGSNLLYYNTGKYKVALSTKVPDNNMGASTNGWISRSINIVFVETIKTIFFGSSKDSLTNIISGDSVPENCSIVLKLKQAPKPAKSQNATTLIQVGDAVNNPNPGGGPVPEASPYVCKNGITPSTADLPFNPLEKPTCVSCQRPSFTENNNTQSLSKNYLGPIVDHATNTSACTHIGGDKQFQCDSSVYAACAIKASRNSPYIVNVGVDTDDVTICPRAQWSSPAGVGGFMFYTCSSSDGVEEYLFNQNAFLSLVATGGAVGNPKMAFLMDHVNQPIPREKMIKICYTDVSGTYQYDKDIVPSLSNSYSFLMNLKSAGLPAGMIIPPSAGMDLAPSDTIRVVSFELNKVGLKMEGNPNIFNASGWCNYLYNTGSNFSYDEARFNNCAQGCFPGMVGKSLIIPMMPNSDQSAPEFISSVNNISSSVNYSVFLSSYKYVNAGTSGLRFFFRMPDYSLPSCRSVLQGADQNMSINYGYRVYEVGDSSYSGHGTCVQTKISNPVYREIVGRFFKKAPIRCEVGFRAPDGTISYPGKEVESDPLKYGNCSTMCSSAWQVTATGGTPTQANNTCADQARVKVCSVYRMKVNQNNIVPEERSVNLPGPLQLSSAGASYSTGVASSDIPSLSEIVVKGGKVYGTWMSGNLGSYPNFAYSSFAPDPADPTKWALCSADGTYTKCTRIQFYHDGGFVKFRVVDMFFFTGNLLENMNKPSSGSGANYGLNSLSFSYFVPSSKGITSCLSHPYTDTNCWSPANNPKGGDVRKEVINYPYDYIVDDDFLEGSVVPHCQPDDPKPLRSYSNCKYSKETYQERGRDVTRDIGTCDITRTCNTPQLNTTQTGVKVPPTVANTGGIGSASVSTPAQMAAMPTGSVTKCTPSGYNDHVEYKSCPISTAQTGGITKPATCRHTIKYDCISCGPVTIGGQALSPADPIPSSHSCKFADSSRVYCKEPVFNACKGDSVSGVKVASSGTQITVCNTDSNIGSADEIVFIGPLDQGPKIGVAPSEAMSVISYNCDADKTCNDPNSSSANNSNTSSTLSAIDPNDSPYEATKVCKPGRNWEEGLVYKAFNSFTTAFDLQAVVYIVLILLLTNKGLGIILGGEKIDATSLVKDVMNISITFAFFNASAWGLYQHFVVQNYMDIVEGLSKVVIQAMDPKDVEGENMFGPIDLVFDDVFLKAATWYRILAILISDITGFIFVIAILFSFFCYLVIFSKAMVQYMSALIMICMYLTLGPLFFMFRIHPRTASYFSNWWKGLLSMGVAQFYLVSVLALFTILYLNIIEAMLYFKICYRSIITIPIANVSILGWWVVPNRIPATLKPYFENTSGVSLNSMGQYPTFSELVVLLVIIGTMEKFMTQPLFGSTDGLNSFFGGLSGRIGGLTSSARNAITSTPMKVAGWAAGKGGKYAGKAFNKIASRGSKGASDNKLDDGGSKGEGASASTSGGEANGSRSGVATSDSETADTKSVSSKSMDSETADTKSVSSKSMDSETADTKSVSSKSMDSETADTKSVSNATSVGESGGRSEASSSVADGSEASDARTISNATSVGESVGRSEASSSVADSSETADSTNSGRGSGGSSAKRSTKQIPKYAKKDYSNVKSTMNTRSDWKPVRKPRAVPRRLGADPNLNQESIVARAWKKPSPKNDS